MCLSVCLSGWLAGSVLDATTAAAVRQTGTHQLLQATASSDSSEATASDLTPREGGGTASSSGMFSDTMPIEGGRSRQRRQTGGDAAQLGATLMGTTARRGSEGAGTALTFKQSLVVESMLTQASLQYHHVTCC